MPLSWCYTAICQPAQRFPHVSPPLSGSCSRGVSDPVYGSRGARAGSRAAPEADTDQPAPAHIATVDGNATLERDGRPESGLLNMPLESGDRLRTTDGRIEVLFGDGSALYVDAQSTVDVQSDELLRLLDGRVRVTILGPARTISYRIDSPAGAVNITQPGDYRMALLHGERETQLELAVLRGTADIFTPQGSTPVRAGQRAYASEGLAPSFAYAFNSAMLDEFDQWIENQHGAQRGISAQYLAPEVQSYAPVLDAEGDWRYNQPYGYVWYPRVATGWRPYYYGRWLSYPRYGWTWVGNDRFGWPTHHYGRWGFSSGAWFWIPGSHWAPAYVSWAYAPGYVSWCPLGFDNRAVFALNVSIGRPYYSSHYSPWNYWTVVAAPHFGYGYVHQRVVHVDRVFAAQSRPVFVSRPSAPAYRGVAVPRGAAPITWAGARGVPSRAGAGAGRDRPSGPLAATATISCATAIARTTRSSVNQSALFRYRHRSGTAAPDDRLLRDPAPVRGRARARRGQSREAVARCRCIRADRRSGLPA